MDLDKKTRLLVSFTFRKGNISSFGCLETTAIINDIYSLPSHLQEKIAREQGFDIVVILNIINLDKLF